jgi:hypothetical protein
MAIDKGVAYGSMAASALARQAWRHIAAATSRAALRQAAWRGARSAGVIGGVAEQQ